MAGTPGGMRCPHCHARGSDVVDSRGIYGGAMIRRRRQCTHCDQRFTTYETFHPPVTPAALATMAGTLRALADRLEKGRPDDV